jgi:Fe2+ transport system protein FeoA
MTSLNQLAVGQRARITGYRKGNVTLLQRLLEMGLNRGAEVAVLRFAPLGDPMEISVRGYQLSVRLQEAALVEVEPISS